MIPREVIGRELAKAELTIERGRVQFFATAIGETDPVFVDVTAARAAGYPDLPVPPTFLFSLDLLAADPFVLLTELGVDLGKVLHGEQSFTYHQQAYAGETLLVIPRIADVYSKKGGALDFMVKQTTMTRPDDGTLVAELTSNVVVRR